MMARTVKIFSRVIAGLQLASGLLLIGLGIAWVVCDSEVKLQSPDEPKWKAVIMAAEIATGFMVGVAGSLGLCSRWKWDCPGIFSVGFQVMNSVIWCPLIIVSYTLLHVVTMNAEWSESMTKYNVDKILISDNGEGAWLWVFPYSGIAISALALILSLIGSCLHCCCAPQSKLKDDLTVDS